MQLESPKSPAESAQNLEVVGLTNEAAMTIEIDSFIETSVNGTLFHRPKFLAYHSAKKLLQEGVSFHHLAFRKRNQLVGFIPGALVRKDNLLSYQSPWGSSVGGPVLQPRTPFKLVAEMASQWVSHVHNLKAEDMSVTVPPLCLQSDFGQESMEYALGALGFRMAESSLLLSVRMDLSDKEFPEKVFEKDARRRIRLARERGCTVKQTDDVETFYELMMATREEENRSAPTHSLDELKWVKQHHSGALPIFLAEFEGRAVGGIVVFRLSPKAATTFYVCSLRKARDINPVLLLNFEILSWAQKERLEWLDYGPSTLGAQPHLSLIHFKEQNGGRGILRRTLRLQPLRQT